MSNFGTPWAFLSVMIWIPAFIFFVGLTYYNTRTKLPLNLMRVRWLCLAVVLSIPAGLLVLLEAADKIK